MEEADAIGDHIVVMSRGKVVCSGSRAFLRKSYGVGYKLALVKTPNTFDLKAALSTVHKTVPSAEVYDEDIDKVQISLNKTDLHNIPSLLDNLEDMRDKLGIASVRVTTATMEDVYAKANDWMPEEKRWLELTNRLDIATICEPVTKKRTLFLCFRGLLVKRLMYLSRSWGFIAACFVVPLLNLLVVDDLLQPYPIFRQLFGLERANEECIGYSEAGFGVQFPDTKVFLHEGRPQHSDMSLKVRVLVESDGGSIEPLEGAESELRRIGMEDFVTYMRSYSMAVIFRGNDTVLGMYNPTTAAALLVLLNVLQTALLRASTNVTTTRIGTRVAYGQFCSSKATLIPNSDILRFYWVLLAASSYSIIFAAFVVFPLVERRCGARDLQLMSGIWGICFLLSHFVFDFICYTVVMALWCSLHYYLYTYSLGTAGSIFLVFVGFSPAVIFYGYLAAEFYSSVGTAFVATVMYVYVNGFLFVAFSYLLPPFLKNWVDYVMKLVPPYGLLQSLVKVSAKEIAAQECLRGNATLDPPALKKHVFAALRDGKIVPLDLISFSEKDYLLEPCAAPSAFAFTDDGIVFDLLCFMVQGILFCITASFFTSGNFLKWQSPTGSEETAPENGVKKEEQLVTKLRQKGQFSDHSVVAWNLQKSYGQEHVVKSFFLALRSSESFGLLGSNGSGKTTTFQMLAGLTSVSYGEAYSPVAILTDSTRLWQSQIGYCPQTGGLLDKLNIYEHLYLIGRLRGIDESSLKVTIDSVLSVVDLKDKSGRNIRSCSASDHRKLHIAIALLGLPPLLFLDEPFAALDLVSRNKISRALQAIRSRSRVSLLISSQNSADCESLCNRIAIMIAGRMMCLGTLQELKDKYGTGRRLKFQLEEERDTAASGSMEKEFIGAVLECFPGAKLALHKKSVFTFGLPDGLSWRELFRKLVELKAKFPIEDAKVADCTLEEIFLAFEKAYKTPECPVDAVEVSEESFHLTAVS